LWPPQLCKNQRSRTSTWIKLFCPVTDINTLRANLANQATLQIQRRVCIMLRGSSHYSRE
jgi:hypothetical protein